MPGLESSGLVELVRVLKGPAFRDVNAQLRQYAPQIAEEVLPHLRLAVSMSRAPQAGAMAATVRVKRDRVPVLRIGAVNPRFSIPFGRKGSDSARRRGSIAHGIMYGPAGGRRDQTARANYYRIPRDSSGGPIARTMTEGSAVKAAEAAYLRAYIAVLSAAGFDATAKG